MNAAIDWIENDEASPYNLRFTEIKRRVPLTYQGLDHGVDALFADRRFTDCIMNPMIMLKKDG
jgi:hypothetical protein